MTLDFKSKIAEILHPLTGFSINELHALIETPPDDKLGDHAFPCFSLAKSMKKAPMAIAKDLAEKAKLGLKDNHLESCSAAGPYVNFFIDKKIFTKLVLEKIHKEKEEYGRGSLKKEKIMVEFSSPNTNKPQHVGHIRNDLLGESLSTILKHQGFGTIKTCLINDRGVHICKSMLAYQKWGNGMTPEKAGKKPDHLVGDFYVMFSKKAAELPELEAEAQDMLRKWEAHDPGTVALWKKMNQWVYDGFNKTYERLGVSFDKFYHESDLYTHGKEIIMEAAKKGTFKEEDGAIVADLTPLKLPKKVLIRSDGTSIYMTQDIYLAKLKFDEYHMDRSIYVVANEQNLHFQQLFAILELLKFPYAKQCYHMNYGYVSLPEGKMKSREGTVVDADNLMDEIEALAADEVKSRYPALNEKEVLFRAKSIAAASLKFFILKYDPASDFIFNPKESISFEGETGPYIQYAYARICSIKEKVQIAVTAEHVDFSLLSDPHEYRLVKLLEGFPRMLDDAAQHYNPSLVARHLFEIAQAFNEFYHTCPVAQAPEKEKQARLLLVECTKIVLENGLALLGIQTLSKM